MASARPSSTMMSPRSNLCTVPATMSPTRPWNSAKTTSRSASRIFWMMTCLAVCAAMRLKSTEEASRLSVTTESRPVLRSMVTVTSCSSLRPAVLRAAVASADSTAWIRISLSIPLSRSMASRIASNSPFMIAFARWRVAALARSLETKRANTQTRKHANLPSSSPSECLLCHANLREWNRHVARGRLDDNRRRLDRQQHTPNGFRSPVLRGDVQLDVFTDRALKVAVAGQRAVQSGRRDLDRVRALDEIGGLERFRNPLVRPGALLDRDPADLVYEQPDMHLAAMRPVCHLHQFRILLGENRLNQRSNLL